MGTLDYLKVDMYGIYWALKKIPSIDRLLYKRQRIKCPRDNCRFEGYGIPHVDLMKSWRWRKTTNITGGGIIALGVYWAIGFAVYPDKCPIESDGSFLALIKMCALFFAMMSIGILLVRSLPDAYDCPNCKTRLAAKEWRKLVGTAKSDGFWN